MPETSAPIFPQPAGFPAKWWRVELRFERRLRVRHIRLLADRFRCEEYPSQRGVGEDGAVLGQWYNSFPGGHDARVILDAVRSVGISARVRAGPYGRDCPNHPGCIADAEEPLPEVGSCACCCDPHFVDADWLAISKKGEPEGYTPCLACRSAGLDYRSCKSCDSSGWIRRVG